MPRLMPGTSMIRARIDNVVLSKIDQIAAAHREAVPGVTTSRIDIVRAACSAYVDTAPVQPVAKSNQK